MNFKKYIAVLVAALMLLSAASCGEAKKADTSKEESVESTAVSEEESSAESGSEESKESFEVRDLEDLSKYITLGTYKGVTVYEKKVTAEMLDENIRALLKTIAELKDTPEGTAAALEDTVTMDYVGYRLDTMEAFDGGTAKDSKLELGSGKFIPGFEDGIVGHKVGDIFDIMVTFPEEYHNAEFSGMEAKFTVTLKKIERPEIPELNDETAKKLKYESATSLKNAVKAAAEDTVKKENMTAAWQEAVKHATVAQYPKDIVDQAAKEYSDYYMSQYKYYAAAGGMELEEYLEKYYGKTLEKLESDLAESSKEYAETSTKQYLVMYAIADAEFGRKITEEEKDEHIKRYAAAEGVSVEQLLQNFTDEVITESVIWDKVMVLVYNAAVMTDVETSEM